MSLHSLREIIQIPPWWHSLPASVCALQFHEMGSEIGAAEKPGLRMHRPRPRARLRKTRSRLGESVRAFRPKAGIPNMRQYDELRIVSRFGPISRALARSGLRLGSCSERELSRFTGRLLVFADSLLGRDVPIQTRPSLTKIPARFFNDYSPDGPLRCILTSCYKFRASRKWSSFEFRDPSRKNDNLLMYETAQSTLRNAGFCSPFKIFFAFVHDQSEISNLSSIVIKHDGLIASDAESATHIIYPDPPGTRENEIDAQVLVRYRKQENYDGKLHALVHWWYHPDSYDDWIDAGEVYGAIEPERSGRSGPWRIQARWIRDLELFNEWMNELDYEIPPRFFENINEYASSQTPSRSHGSHLRLRLRPDEINAAPSPKRMRTDVDYRQLVEGKAVSREIDFGTVAPASSSNTAPMNELEVASITENTNGSIPASGSVVVVDNITVQEIPIPDFSVWFDMQHVHEIERKALPEFFTGNHSSKNEKVYREIRDFMVTTWREEPQHYLSATAVRRQIRADACAVQRLHGFLEHWGLINFGHEYESMPQPILVPPPIALPTEAGRIDPSTGRHCSLLFLDDGSPVAIADERIRRVHLDGCPQPISINTARTINDVLDSRRDLGTEDIATPEPKLRQRGDDGAASIGAASAPPRVNGTSEMSSARSLRAERLSRSARSVYGRYGRRSRNPRYVADDSSDEDEEEDDSDDDEEGIEDPGSATDHDVAGEHSSEGNNGKDSGGAIEYHCDICSTDCSRVRYHCATRADMDLCQTCFKESKYPPAMQPRDFIQMTAAPVEGDEHGALALDPHVWSESETLLLLEALEMYGDRWDMVAEHVASKNHIQCVLQFLRLPIEEGFYAQMQEKWWTAKSPGDVASQATSPIEMLKQCGAKDVALAEVMRTSSSSKSLTGKPLVFSDKMNTITPQIALLISLVPSNVISSVMKACLSANTTRRPSSTCVGQETSMTGENGLHVSTSKTKEFHMDVGGKGAEEAIGVSKAAESMKRLRNVISGDKDLQSIAELSTEHCVTDVLYRDIVSAIEYAEIIAGSSVGIEASNNALALFTSGPGTAHGDVLDANISLSTTSSLQPENSARKWVEQSQGFCGQDKGNCFESESDPTQLPSTATEHDSTFSVAATATAAAAIRSRKLAVAESLEVERLFNLVYEIKLDMIRMKLQHLRAILTHKDKSRTYSHHERCKAFGDQYNVARVKVTGADAVSPRDEKLCILQFSGEHAGGMRDEWQGREGNENCVPSLSFTRASTVTPVPESLNVRSSSGIPSTPSRVVPPPLPPPLPPNAAYASRDIYSSNLAPAQDVASWSQSHSNTDKGVIIISELNTATTRERGSGFSQQ